MQRYSTYCPNCHNQLESGSGKRKKRIGNPFKRCPFCGNSYVDGDVKEWITMSPIGRFNFIVSIPFCASVLLSMFFTALLIKALDTSVALIMGLIMFFIAVVIFSIYNKVLQKQSIKESLKRTESKTYVELLKHAKFKIHPIKGVDVGTVDDTNK